MTAGLVFLAGYLCLAQPGMCPYWMIGDVSILSGPPASGEHARPQHNHNENRDNFLATVAPALPQVVLSAAALLALLAARAMQIVLRAGRLTLTSWQRVPPAPPPRLALPL